MTGTEFKETCQEVIHKHKTMKKIIFLIITTWISMVATMEIGVLHELIPLYILLPLGSTVIVCTVTSAVFLFIVIIKRNNEIWNLGKEAYDKKQRGY